MNDTLDTFQTQLLTQLRREVIERPRQARHPAPSSASRGPRRSTARRLSLAGLVAGAAASVAVSLGLVSVGSAGTTPAFAVTTADNGDVVVTITGPADAGDLEAALREHGLDAKVIYDDSFVPAGGCIGTRGALGGFVAIGNGPDPNDPENYPTRISWTSGGSVSVVRVHGSFDDADLHMTLFMTNHDGVIEADAWRGQQSHVNRPPETC